MIRSFYSITVCIEYENKRYAIPTYPSIDILENSVILMPKPNPLEISLITINPKSLSLVFSNDKDGVTEIKELPSKRFDLMMMFADHLKKKQE